MVISPDCPAGPIRWQAANANGITATGVFMVSHSPEQIESERHELPQVIDSLPTIISGRLERIEEVDRYRFSASHTGLVTCSLFARRIGSSFYGAMEVHEADGRKVAEAFDTEGWDPDLTFAVQQGRDYIVSVHDVDFRGDRSYVYRLRLIPGPRVLAARPAAGRRGQTARVEFIGIGLVSGTDKLESITREVAFPNDSIADRFDYRLETPHGAAPDFPLLLSDLDERVEQDHPAGQPESLDGPAGVTGDLRRRGEGDAYTCTWRKGDLWAIAATARPIGATIDPLMVIRDGAGKELARAGDAPGSLECELEFSVPADGVYTVSVSDVAGRGGSRTAGYRLAIERARADFRLQTKIQRLSIPLEGRGELPISVIRRGGFQGPIELTLAGLPGGVTAEGSLQIPADKSEIVVHLASAADAAATASVIKIRGTTQWHEASLSHRVLAPAPGNLAPRSADESRIGRLVVATTLKPVCKVEPVVKDGGQLVHRGTTFPAEIDVQRLNGFDGPVVLEMASQQQRHRQGITAQSVTVPPGVSRTAFGCYMPEWLETARTSRMAVIGVAQVKDPQGNFRSSVADVSGQITMTIEGALLKIAPAARELTAPAGTPLPIEVRLQRSPTLVEPARVELRLGEELQGLLTAEPLLVAASQATATLHVVPAAGHRPLGRHKLSIRATIMQDGRWPVISETSVPVEFVEPSRD